GARGNPPIRTHPSILRATPCTSAPTSARPRSHSRTDAHARYIAAMLRETRHERLLKLLREEGVLPVGRIAQRLGVSEATARRDLTELDGAGMLTRVYGGAVARTPAERPFAEE